MRPSCALCPCSFVALGSYPCRPARMGNHFSAFSECGRQEVEFTLGAAPQSLHRFATIGVIVWLFSLGGCPGRSPTPHKRRPEAASPRESPAPRRGRRTHGPRRAEPAAAGAAARRARAPRVALVRRRSPPPPNQRVLALALRSARRRPQGRRRRLSSMRSRPLSRPSSMRLSQRSTTREQEPEPSQPCSRHCHPDPNCCRPRPYALRSQIHSTVLGWSDPRSSPSSSVRAAAVPTRPRPESPSRRQLPSQRSAARSKRHRRTIGSCSRSSFTKRSTSSPTSSWRRSRTTWLRTAASSGR